MEERERKEKRWNKENIKEVKEWYMKRENVYEKIRKDKTWKREKRRNFQQENGGTLDCIVNEEANTHRRGEKERLIINVQINKVTKKERSWATY